MPGNIGFPELVLLLVIVLLLFGPKKLPDFARSMGNALREFRRASQEVMDDIHRVTEEPAPVQTASARVDTVPYPPAPVEAPAGEVQAAVESGQAATTEAAPEAASVEQPTTKQL